MAKRPSEKKRYKVETSPGGSERYVRLPLGSNWTDHPEAAAIGVELPGRRSDGRHHRAMTVDDCISALAVARRHAKGHDAEGKPVDPRVSDGAKRVVRKLKCCLEALADENVPGAAEALASLLNPAEAAGAPAISPRPLFVLTWNFDKGELGKGSNEQEYQERVDQTSAGNGFPEPWTTGRRKSGIAIDDTVVLLLHGSRGGIIASGHARSEIESHGDSDNWIDVEWDRWVPVEDRLPREALREIAPRFQKPVQQSGERLADDQAAALLDAWNQMHAGAVALSGDEAGVLLEDGQTAPEGAIKKVPVNRYERSAWARRACIEIHGTRCKVCDMDFGETYGEFAAGRIHVHHLTPLAHIKNHAKHEVNPRTDLVPVCANCHWMLHTHPDQPCSPQKLRRLLKRQAAK